MPSPSGIVAVTSCLRASTTDTAAPFSGTGLAHFDVTVPLLVGESLRFVVFSDAQGTVTLSGNTSEGNFGNGIFVGSEGVGLVNATFKDNTTNGNTGNG